MEEKDARRPSSTSLSLTQGTRVGPYEILEELGTGGMGSVFLALDARLERRLALKFVDPRSAETEDSRERLVREAKAAAKLAHPNIVTVYDVGEHMGRVFLGMEYVEGHSLRNLIDTGGLSTEQALDVFGQICDGLRAAHVVGIVHRDLKPSNIIVTPEGRAKILDFGLAKTLTDPQHTQEGTLLGTVDYMSPEQTQGKVVDQRSDIFSAGIVFYELLTGTNPFVRGFMPATIYAITYEQPEPLATRSQQAPVGCQVIVDKALAKNISERYQTVDALIEDLKRVRGGQSIAPNTVSAGSIPASTAFGTPSIAVLPFVNMSGDEENEYFADGLSEELLNVLAKIRGLRVAARTSSFQFRGRDVDVATVAQKLNVATVLTGSVRKAGKRVRISAQLIKVADGFHLWSETYDRDLEDIFAVQDDIARSVVKELRSTLLGEEPDSAASRVVREELHEAVKGRAENAEAYRLYLMARFFADRWTRGDAEKGIEYCRQALVLDPKYAAAWAEMSRVYWILAGNGWTTPTLGFTRARETAERALELEPDLAEAHVALGRVRMTYDWDWDGADESYQRALELAPGNVAVLRAVGMLAGNLGRSQEALTLSGQAVALDPLSATAHNSLGANYFRAGRLEEAEAAMTKSLELNPRAAGAQFCLGVVHLSQGRFEEAETTFKAETSEVFRLLGMAHLWHARKRPENSDVALRELIEKYSEDWTYQIAQAYAFRGEVDLAFEWLNRAYDRRDPGLSEMKPDPLMRNLHADPRWRSFLQKMGLPD